jgi:hypothetical protein
VAIARKKAAITIALILMFTMAASMTVIPAVHAPSTEVVPTWLMLSAQPSPVGVGQVVYVNAFMTKPTSTAYMMGTGDMYENITVVVTAPDGTKQTYGPYRADPTGGTWFTYKPATTGNYTFQAFYPGQVLTWSPQYGDRYVGLRYLPDESDIARVVVQEEPIPPGYSSPPLPTEYWSRPIYAQNYAWTNIGSNWYQPGSYDASGKFNPIGTAPTSSHIVWTMPTQFGGQPGDIFANQESNYYSQSLLAQYFQTPIILNGVMYTTLYTGTGIATNWTAIDLRTGQTLWTTNRGRTGSESLKMGQIVHFHTLQEYGSYAVIWSVSGSTFYIYDAMTGLWMATINGVTNGNFIQDFSDTTAEPGTVYEWYTTTNTTGVYLNLWNSTRCIGYPSATPGTGNWPLPSMAGQIGPSGYTSPYALSVRPSGTYNFSAGIQYWQPIPTTLAGNPIGPANLSLSAVSFGDLGAKTSKILLLRSAGTVAAQSSNGYQITAGYDALTGALLWGPLNQTLPKYHDIAFISAREGVYVLHDKDTNEAYGYSLTNGQKIWGPIKLPGNAWSNIARAGMIAYGNVYIHDYGGYVNALDLQTGKINWTFTPVSAGYNTPYGIYPLWTQTPFAICDGMLFYAQGKMYDPPLSPGCQQLAINATTGELVWSILSYNVKYPAAFADGYMVDWNSYDKQIYTFGKGPTATTVMASPKISVHGSSVLVEGMVTDESPGTKDTDRISRFPNGVPAVADEDMSAWMEYVYMQQIKPADVKGVDVVVSVSDPNGNTYDVGTATSGAHGFYSMTFTPEVPGKYTIIAKFEGSESYWRSDAETAINVEDAPAASPSPTPPPESPADLYFMPVSAGMIAAIVAVVALLLLLLFRKR